jgi:hypothetical protein
VMKSRCRFRPELAQPCLNGRTEKQVIGKFKNCDECSVVADTSQ